MTGKVRIALRVAMSVAFSVAVASMFLYTFLEDKYFNYPRVKNAQLGRIVPYKVKSIIVYITQDESLFVHAAFTVVVISVIIVLAGFFINLRWPFIKKR
jgi:hypothetical protein